MENRPRRSCLLRYSQDDLLKLPKNESYGLRLEEAFEHGTSTLVVEHFAHCLESHQEHGNNYHVFMELKLPKRWKSTKDYLFQRYNVAVSFEGKQDYYIAVYCDIKKDDKEVYHSVNHPALESISLPKTKTCIVDCILSQK